MTELIWTLKDNYNHYYRLDSLNFSPYFDCLEGVYVIWYRDSLLDITVYAGQGIIKDRLYYHQFNNPKIRQYASKTLYATWARANKDEIDGIEAYLHDRLNPLASYRKPNVPSIFVNLPPLNFFCRPDLLKIWMWVLYIENMLLLIIF